MICVNVNFLFAQSFLFFTTLILDLPGFLKKRVAKCLWPPMGYGGRVVANKLNKLRNFSSLPNQIFGNTVSICLLFATPLSMRCNQLTPSPYYNSTTCYIRSNVFCSLYSQL